MLLLFVKSFLFSKKVLAFTVVHGQSHDIAGTYVPTLSDKLCRIKVKKFCQGDKTFLKAIITNFSKIECKIIFLNHSFSLCYIAQMAIYCF